MNMLNEHDLKFYLSNILFLQNKTMSIVEDTFEELSTDNEKMIVMLNEIREFDRFTGTLLTLLRERAYHKAYGEYSQKKNTFIDMDDCGEELPSINNHSAEELIKQPQDFSYLEWKAACFMLGMLPESVD